MHDPFVSNTALHKSTMHSTVILMHYADINKVAALIKAGKHQFLSQDGILIASEKSHQLWISDYDKNIEKISEFTRSIDKPCHQFLLKSRIVSIDEDYAREIGLMFEGGSKKTVEPALTTIGSFVFPLANLGDGHLLDMKLDALERKGHAKIVSSPEITTQDFHKAVIEAGEEVPYQQETANGGTSVAFKKAVLKLEVVPRWINSGQLMLQLHINQDKVSALTVQGVPAIQTQQLATEVMMRSGQTFALGGITESKLSNQHQSIPFLSKIPLLGYLFQTHHKKTNRRELLVFITVDSLS